MGSATARRSIRDAVARSDEAKLPHGQAAAMEIVTSGAVTKVGYLLAPAPCPFGCTVLSAKLQMFQKGTADTGSRVLGLYLVNESWREGTLTWNDRPDQASSASVTVTVSGAGADGRMVEWDVTDDYQDFVDRVRPNFGWAIQSSNANSIRFNTSEANKLQPRLVVTWSNRPEAPTDMVPAGSRYVATPKPPLTWTFADYGGDATLTAVQVQLKATATGWDDEDGFASPSFDTGEVPASTPGLALASTSYAGVSAGNGAYWTARHLDGSGRWSKWSDPVQFLYQPYTSATLTSPGPTVNDTTFPWTWTTADQSRFRARILDAQGEELSDSRRITSTDLRTYTTPRGVVRKQGVTLTAQLRLWDSYPRQAVPGFPAYKELTQTFSYSDTGTVAPVTSLFAETIEGAPGVVLTWTRDTVPDQFTIWVDGNHHTTVNGPDVLVTSGSYATTLYDIPAGAEHTLEVKAVTTSGGTTKSSSGNATETVAIDYVGVWLLDPDQPDLAVLMLKDGDQDIISTTMPEVVETFEVVGSSVGVQATSALRWFSGDVTDGVLADDDHSTAAEKRARVLAMKGNRTSSKLLIWRSNAVPVLLSNVNVTEDDVLPRFKATFHFDASVASPEYALS